LLAQPPGEEDLDAGVVAEAEKLWGLELTGEERQLMLQDLRQLRQSYAGLRRVELDNAVPPCLVFDPRPAGFEPPPVATSESFEPPPVVRPDDPDDLAFLPVTHLASLVQSRQVTATELTELYLERLERYDALLECVITLTAERARRQAREADREIAAGRYRGPLHGIPWGAKDLLAVRGYPTTWGAMPYRDQVLDLDATVVERLDAAGAILVGKLSLGALAWGDVWFDGRTRNPWNPEEGSSGSSAGSAAATAAGLVGFSIGTETLGSIVSPCTRCGASGLRPSFGRVSRHGAMALSWSMDKVGPICRSAEDCALVFDAIRGPDGRDRSLLDEPYSYRPSRWRELRVGYVPRLFDDREGEEDEESTRELDLAVLDVLRRVGVELVPIELPDLPVGSLSFILNAEAAAAFDGLTRGGDDDRLVRQARRAWPNAFRVARTIPAVEYIQGNRIRTLLQEAMGRALEGVDVYVAPSFAGNNLLLTNLTGHPTVVVPSGLRANGSPASISFVGRLFREDAALAVGALYQQATDVHRRRPDFR
jgi:Asp-tRNA(Asn)/Glu-tRNA(Gln) amidotransferase A subunit family amidase